MIDPAALQRAVRDRCFAGLRPRAVAGPRRVGAELELLTLRAADRRPAGLSAEILPWIRAYAARAGWTTCPSPKGAPRFATPGGGTVSFEPGGQIEYATLPHRTPGALVDDLQATMAPLVDDAREAGLMLLAAGIDPYNSLVDAPLQVQTPRYAAMDSYFAARGTAGARMMRQTAAIQVSVDFGLDPTLQWRVLNAAAPLLTALFAASRYYAGADTGHASFRAHCWRRLDPRRTGIFSGDDPVAEYAAFAAAAPVMILPGGERVAGAGADSDALLAAHLSTLFPDIRPRGYLEVRCMDTIDVAAIAAPILLVDALVGDDVMLRAAAELLGRPDPSRLVMAGETGLRDPGLRSQADELIELARAAWRRAPTRYRGRDVEDVEAWLHR